MAPLLSAGGPENVNKLMNQYRGLLFPEEKIDALHYMKKAEEYFKKLRGVNLYVQPTKTRG